VKINFTTVGTIGKPHGTGGAFHFVFNLPLAGENFPNVFFVETKNGSLPYFPKEVNLKDEFSGIMQFEEIDSREKIVPLVNASLLLKEKDVATFFEEELTDNFDGFEVIDKLLGKLGKVNSTTSNTVQTVLSIELHGKEVMFPMVENFIEKIDYEKKELHTNLPEGLIETYTQNNEENDED
jgi:16S rRNA processing protein RimM